MIILIVTMGIGCARPQSAKQPPAAAAPSGDPKMAPPNITDVLSRHTPSLMAIPGVTGTGEGKRGTQTVLVVYVEEATPELRKQIPAEVEGYRVELREIGKVTAPPP
jgi:hypothetical protein